jgi:hypothetical protein
MVGLIVVASLAGPAWKGWLVLASLAGPGPTVTLDRRSGVAGVPFNEGQSGSGPRVVATSLRGASA